MAEYIEREALLLLIEERKLNTCNGTVSCLQMQRMVERIPSADVAPVRHGRLIETGMDEAWCSWGDCSACGRSNIMGSKYCNWCGVKLDGGADNG